MRTALEHGRVLNSAGKPAAAVVQFARAAGLAAGARLDFLAADALHMLAIADPVRAGEWTRRGLATALASPDPRTQRWAVALHGNLGWSLYDAGEHADALLAFAAALREARRVGTPTRSAGARRAWPPPRRRCARKPTADIRPARVEA